MTSINKIARISGVLYLVITAAAIVAHMYVPSTLIVPGDAATTAANISADESLFRIGIAAELVILLSELALSILLYVLLKPVNNTLSLIAAVSRLAMTAIHGVNLLNQVFALLLVGGAGYLSAFSAEQLQSLMMLFLDAYDTGFTIGIVFLTVHVFALGTLIFRSGYIPKALGILFLLAAVGYLIDSTALLFVPGYETTPAPIMLIIAVAEIAFPVWLLIKGVNVEKWEDRALASASLTAEGAPA